MNKTHKRKWIVLISPLLIIVIENFAARLFTDLLGKWAWIGYFLVYWGMLFLFMAFAGKKENQQAWFRKSQGNRWWVLLAIGQSD